MIFKKQFLQIQKTDNKKLSIYESYSRLNSADFARFTSYCNSI